MIFGPSSFQNSVSAPPVFSFCLRHCLKWGNQRFLRCVKVSPSDIAEPSSLDRRSLRCQSKFDQSQQLQMNPRFSKPPTSNPFHSSKRKSPPSNTHKDITENKNNNIEAVREKIMTDLRVAAKKLKVSILEEGGGEDEAAANARPWNLRTRRAAGKAPIEEGKRCDLVSSPKRICEAVVAKENHISSEKNEKTKFSISLSKEEVEEDFYVMVGTRPPRRPKKRPRIVQRQLDSLFPGLWLTEVTSDSYKVSDVPE